MTSPLPSTQTAGICDLVSAALVWSPSPAAGQQTSCGYRSRWHYRRMTSAVLLGRTDSLAATASSSGTFIAFTAKSGLSQFVVLVAAESTRLFPLGRG
ncbi:hypothetical protein VTK26DRAFT_8983 [Humicola hyalothermophila]